ncbi:MAG: prolyl hydroxylase family protein [Acidimicrobiales bacterium]
MNVTVRESYDLGEQVADDPMVVVVDDFITSGERTHIINLARNKMKRGKVTLDDDVAFSEGRTGSTAWIPHDSTPVVRGLVKRVSELVKIPIFHAESLQVVHYAETEEYKAHHDSWKIGTDRHAQRTANGGQRLVTALMYLNEVDAGGGTGFPKLKLEVEPIPGRMVLFHNTTGIVNDVHKKSLHGGLPVLYGEKWACNLWFRELPYDRPGKSKGLHNKAHAQKARPGGTKSRNRKKQKAARRKNR